MRCLVVWESYRSSLLTPANWADISPRQPHALWRHALRKQITPARANTVFGHVAWNLHRPIIQVYKKRLTGVSLLPETARSCGRGSALWVDSYWTQAIKNQRVKGFLRVQYYRGRTEKGARPPWICSYGVRVISVICYLPQNARVKKYCVIFHITHRVSKNVPPMTCCNFDTHEQILIFFWQKCYR